MSITRRLLAAATTTIAAGAVLVGASGAAHADPIVLVPRSHVVQAAFNIFVDPADQPGQWWNLNTSKREIKWNSYQAPWTIWGCKNGLYAKGLVTPSFNDGQPSTHSADVRVDVSLTLRQVSSCSNPEGTIVRQLETTSSTFYVKRLETVYNTTRVDNSDEVTPNADWHNATLYTTLYDVAKTPA
jgi:hypothetical protein